MAQKNGNVINIYIEKDFVDELRLIAKKNKLSLSAWLRLAAVEKIRREEQETLRKPC